MQLKEMIEITGIIRVLTGLHIGAGKDSMEIGGMDQPIIKEPITRAPYIPGSSLKGKMRSLLEQSVFLQNEETRRYIMKGSPCGCGKRGCPACTLFGTSAAEKDDDLGPTRLIVRDAFLTDKWRERFNEGKLPMEVKYENTIHRLRGTADHPRPLERVPAGVEFDLSMTLKIFEGDDREQLLESLKKGLKMVELDALGGNSSRGCGQVRFAPLYFNGEEVDLSQVQAL